MATSEPWLILSLFDWSGNWSRPYREAGYPVLQFDKLLGGDLMDFDYRRIPADSVRGILAALPCTHFTKASSMHWKAMDADGRTKQSVALARRTLEIVEYHCPRWWVIENPPGRLPRLVPELAKQRIMSFNPKDYGDGYTKQTELFGQFNPLLVRAPNAQFTVPSSSGDHAVDIHLRRLHPGIPRVHRRSITPPRLRQGLLSSEPISNANMATQLRKAVRRELYARTWRNERLIAGMEPGDLLSFRVAGKKTTYPVSLHQCFQLAVWNKMIEQYKDDLERYEQRRRAGYTRLRKPRRPNFAHVVAHVREIVGSKSPLAEPRS